ncbi:Oidioi.mRNA.OKI2018_I69.PAR.g13150.t1.cds [Oikopleura dioica]|uniref:Large ribosomal subunit protein eL6 n=1 Tax=Oikopleura dioica TaxID=34765 RepID=A0ABN7S3E7_OIKDI|nr:Oidioi.mRNA.OKI2018_I69.PAR.g13150.t1.cds [Oikopleura dioica]
MARNSTVNGVAKYSRSKMYSRRAQHKRTKPVTKVEAKKAAFVSTKTVGGDKNGGTRKVVARREPKYYPTLSIRKKLVGHGQKTFSAHQHSLRSSIVPGSVLILLTGVHRGKRVVFLKQLESGLLLVTGPYKVNGVPLRRAIASQVIATSAKVDVSNIAVPEHVNDAYFKRTKAAKKTEEGIFEKTQEKYSASEQRKADQKSIDAALLAPIAATPYLKGYLQAQFGLSRGQYPHNLKF